MSSTAGGPPLKEPVPFLKKNQIGSSKNPFSLLHLPQCFKNRRHPFPVPAEADSRRFLLHNPIFSFLIL